MMPHMNAQRRRQASSCMTLNGAVWDSSVAQASLAGAVELCVQLLQGLDYVEALPEGLGADVGSTAIQLVRAARRRPGRRPPARAAAACCTLQSAAFWLYATRCGTPKRVSVQTGPPRAAQALQLEAARQPRLADRVLAALGVCCKLSSAVYAAGDPSAAQRPQQQQEDQQQRQQGQPEASHSGRAPAAHANAAAGAPALAVFDGAVARPLLEALRRCFLPRRAPFWGEHGYGSPDCPFFSYHYSLVRTALVPACRACPAAPARGMFA